jgi:hypothetical protein
VAYTNANAGTDTTELSIVMTEMLSPELGLTVASIPPNMLNVAKGVSACSSHSHFHPLLGIISEFKPNTDPIAHPIVKNQHACALNSFHVIYKKKTKIYSMF